MENVLSNNLQKVKISLNDAIQKWIDDACSSEDGWSEVGYVSNNLAELMGNAAFTVLLSQKDLNEYLEKENVIAD